MLLSVTKHREDWGRSWSKQGKEGRRTHPAVAPGLRGGRACCCLFRVVRLRGNVAESMSTFAALGQSRSLPTESSVGGEADSEITVSGAECDAMSVHVEAGGGKWQESEEHGISSWAERSNRLTPHTSRSSVAPPVLLRQLVPTVPRTSSHHALASTLTPLERIKATRSHRRTPPSHLHPPQQRHPLLPHLWEPNRSSPSKTID